MSKKIAKKALLLIERNTELQKEIERELAPFYEITACSSVDQCFQELQAELNFFVVVTNANLHPDEHSFMDGFSILRRCQSMTLPIPVIVYTNDLHPLALFESTFYGAFKILDQSHSDFKRNLLTAIHYASKIVGWQQQYEASNKNAKRFKEMLSEINLVAPIQWNYIDENLYNCFFWSNTQDLYCYANSWAYFCQAARNNGHKFFNGSCLISITTDNFCDIDNIRFNIINPMGPASGKKTLELAETLKQLSKNSVIIKKASQFQREYLLKSGKCEILTKPTSNRLEDQFDDIHPQIVVNLKAFMDHLTSKKLLNFRRNLTKFSQKNYTMRTATPELFDDFWEVVLKWKRSFIKRYEARKEFTDIPQDDPYYTNPYFPIFIYYSRFIDNHNTLSSLVYVDNIPVGFSFLSRVSDKCMGMYANLADTEYEGLAEFMLYQNLTKAYWCGYEFVNLGRTESEYLYNFYRRLALDSGIVKSFEIKSDYLIYG